jgi:hypothetical protein
MPEHLPVSVIILAHQDTKLLRSAIASAAWASQRIVIDIGADLSQSQLTAAGVQHLVTLSGTITDFAAIRNQVMKHADHDWILFLDSDEVIQPLTTDQQQDLAMLLNNSQLGGMSLRRSDVFLEKKLSHGEAGNQKITRLIRRDQGQWQGAVHETWQTTLPIAESSLKLEHHAHHSISAFIADISGYAMIAADNRRQSSLANYWQLLTYPLGKILYDAILLQGARDGWRGVVYCYCMALHSLLVRLYWYEKHLGVAAR